MTTDTNTLTLEVKNYSDYIIENDPSTSQFSIPITNNVIEHNSTIKIPLNKLKNDADTLIISPPDIELFNDTNGPDLRISVASGWTNSCINKIYKLNYTGQGSDEGILLSIELTLHCYTQSCSEGLSSDVGGGIAMVGTVSMIIAK